SDRDPRRAKVVAGRRFCERSVERVGHAMARPYPSLRGGGKVKEMLRRSVVTAIFVFLAASCGSSSSQPTYDDAIQEGQSAAQELLEHGASAVAIALVDSDRIIWRQAFGFADRDADEAATDSTMFGIGSISKMFAAIAVMKLVDRGVVDLDTP